MKNSHTPVCDFVEGYAAGRPLRLHMPGHKGLGEAERLDITEIQGADPLYADRGVLKQCADNAAALFGSGRSLLSAEGSSLCVRAMVALARLRAESEGLPPVILAGRNAHRTFLSAAALMGMEVVFLPAEGLLTCRPTPRALREALERLPAPPAAVYLTSPDYLGHLADIAGLAPVCHERGVPLLVDNAHGAYLRFLPEDRHPLSLGADLVCDSAHKTLPALTGAAWLHLGHSAPALFLREADRAMGMFASTSPSWLILQSLDRCQGRLMEGSLRRELAVFAEKTAALKRRLEARGFALRGEEPLKITLAPKGFGYTGDHLHDLLRERGIECEFSDPDFLVMMVAPATGEDGLARLEDALAAVPRKAPIPEEAPPLPRAERALGLREAMLSPAEILPAENSAGRILADPCVSCPPAVPIVLIGERITPEAIRCFRYYGIDRVSCVAE